MSLRCTRCGREFPSEYWFKIPGICIQCFPSLTPEELSRQAETVVIPSKPERPFPSLVQAFVLLPIMFLAFVTLAAMLKNALSESAPEGLRFMLFYVVSLGPVVILSLGIVTSRGRTFRSIYAWTFPRPALFLQVVLIALITWACSGMIAVQLVGPVTNTPTQTDFLGAITRVLFAPFLEETLFRGIVLGSLLMRMTAWKAILASSILFALFHVNPVLMLVGLPLGLVFGWLYFRAGSVVPTITIHFIVNVTGLTLTYIALQNLRPGPSVTTPVQAAIAILVSVCILIATAFWLKHVDRKFSSSRTAPA